MSPADGEASRRAKEEAGGVLEPLLAGGEEEDVVGGHGDPEAATPPSTDTDGEKQGHQQRRLLLLAAHQWPWLLVGCAALIVRLPFSIVQPHLVSGVIGSLLARDTAALQRNLGFFLAAGTLDAALDFWCVFLFSFTKNRIIRDLRSRLFANLLAQEAAFYDGSRTGELLSRMTSDTVEMANDLTWVFRFSIEAVVRITGVGAYMFWSSPSLAKTACSAIPLVALGNRVYGRWVQRNAEKVQAALAEANARAAEVLAAVRTVFAFANEDRECAAYRRFLDEHYGLNNWQAVADGLYYMLFSTFLMQVIVQALILAYGSYLYWQRELELEQLLAFLLYRAQLQEWTGKLLDSFSNLLKSSGAARQVFVLLERKPRHCQPTEARVTPRGSARGEVSFQAVHFAYPTRPDASVLRGLSFDVQPGQLLALTGPSGAGKSTCFHLLEHFYEPSAGRVLLDGFDVSHLDHKWLHRNVGLVGQEPVLFSGTVLENIVYSLSNQPEHRALLARCRVEGGEVPEEVVRAAEVGNAHRFIMDLPKGYRTEIGEKGVQLSGGQKQRVAIARAVLQDPRVLLLDEATSSLDAESEGLVQAALEAAMRGRTTLVIAHRLSTVRAADRILVLSKGEVVEEGTHSELMRRPLRDGQTTYRALVQRQHAFQDDS